MFFRNEIERIEFRLYLIMAVLFGFAVGTVVFLFKTLPINYGEHSGSLSPHFCNESACVYCINGKEFMVINKKSVVRYMNKCHGKR
jgi:hypothetical protein